MSNYSRVWDDSIVTSRFGRNKIQNLQIKKGTRGHVYMTVVFEVGTDKVASSVVPDVNEFRKGNLTGDVVELIWTMSYDNSNYNNSIRRRTNYQLHVFSVTWFWLHFMSSCYRKGKRAVYSICFDKPYGSVRPLFMSVDTLQVCWPTWKWVDDIIYVCFGRTDTESDKFHVQNELFAYSVHMSSAKIGEVANISGSCQ